MAIRIRLDEVEEEQRKEETNEEQESRVHMHVARDEFGFEDKRAGFKFQKCGGGRRVIHKTIGSK